MRTIWNKLSKSRKYRQQFVLANAKRAFAFQLRAIMRKRGISQERLAELCGLTQGVISRAADPEYGTLTVTTKAKIANGLDMVYLGVLISFSDAAKWFSNLSEEAVQVPTFEEENSELNVSLPELGSVDLQTSDLRAKKRTASAAAMGHNAQYGSAEELGSCLQNKAA